LCHRDLMSDRAPKHYQHGDRGRHIDQGRSGDRSYDRHDQDRSRDRSRSRGSRDHYTDRDRTSSSRRGDRDRHDDRGRGYDGHRGDHRGSASREMHRSRSPARRPVAPPSAQQQQQQSRQTPKTLEDVFSLVCQESDCDCPFSIEGLTKMRAIPGATTIVKDECGDCPETKVVGCKRDYKGRLALQVHAATCMNRTDEDDDLTASAKMHRRLHAWVDSVVSTDSKEATLKRQLAGQNAQHKVKLQSITRESQQQQDRLRHEVAQKDEALNREQAEKQRLQGDMQKQLEAQQAHDEQHQDAMRKLREEFSSESLSERSVLQANLKQLERQLADKQEEEALLKRGLEERFKRRLQMVREHEREELEQSMAQERQRREEEKKGEVNELKQTLSALNAKLGEKEEELEEKVDALEDLEDTLKPTMMQNNILMSKLDAMYLLVADAVSVAGEISKEANEALAVTKTAEVARAIKDKNTIKLDDVVRAVRTAVDRMPERRAVDAGKALGLRTSCATTRDQVISMLSDHFKGTTAGR